MPIAEENRRLEREGMAGCQIAEKLSVSRDSAAKSARRSRTFPNTT